MRIYVGLTDYEWFSCLKNEYQKGRLNQKLVNFWKPGTRGFGAINEGELFLFKLHSKRGSEIENGAIVGGGTFLRYETKTISEAWEQYGNGNGYASAEAMNASINAIRGRNNGRESETIGCIILKDVIFFDKEIRWPENIEWSNSIVSGKTFSNGEAQNLREHVNGISRRNQKNDTEIVREIEDLKSLEGRDKVAIVKARANQGIFRDRLLGIYKSCCLCHMKNSALLTASHIKPWAKSKATEKLDEDNGFLLCPNHDALFDKGFITFDNDGKIVISKKLSEQDCKCANVSVGMKIELSDGNKKYLRYHQKYVFLDKAK